MILSRYILILSILFSFTFCKELENGGENPPVDSPVPEKPQSEYLVGKSFKWDNVKIGGGGYVTGIAIHPVRTDLRYIRTDVGGAYRWDNSSKEWVQLLNEMENGQLIGVDGMALDANKSDRIYLAVGKSSESDGGVFRSDDCGESWEKIFAARFGGNEALRWIGECLAVDPHTSSVIYCGTRTNGLYSSTDEGYSWHHLSGVPPGTNGIRTIAIDSTVKNDGRSALIYAGIPGEGLYRSIDGGNSFDRMNGAPVSPNRMECSKGKLFVTHTTGVALWDGLNWMNITPSGSENKNYCGLAIEPGNPDKIVVAHKYNTFNNPIFRTQNGGLSWIQVNAISKKSADVPWWPSNWFSSATAAMAFDPHNKGHLYYTDWFGVWFTPDVWSPKVNWKTIENGHEETVVLTLTAPADEALVYSGVCDVFAFKHTSLNAYPNRLGKSLSGVNNCFSIAFCEDSPTNIAFVASKGDDRSGTTIKVSADGGENWADCTVSGNSRLGRIAVSASNPNNMVYMGGGSTGVVYYTRDRGKTWQASEGVPTGAAGNAPDDVWNKDFPLVADCVDRNRFYLFKKGILYSTNDGGARWTVQNNVPIPDQDRFLFVAARPEKSGEVWISLHNNGLYKTTDGGKSIVKVSAFSASKAFAWGAPSPESQNATAYCYGTIAGITGMFASTTSGKEWVKINDDTQKFPSDVKCMAGDRNSFGRVYVGTGGQGVLFGEL